MVRQAWSAGTLAIHVPSMLGLQRISSLNPSLCRTRSEDAISISLFKYISDYRANTRNAALRLVCLSLFTDFSVNFSQKLQRVYNVCNINILRQARTYLPLDSLDPGLVTILHSFKL